MSKRLVGGIIGCKDKTSSWHLIGFVSFVFVVLLSLKPWAFIQPFFFLRYACASTGTRSYLTTNCLRPFFVFFCSAFFCFCFFSLEKDVAFPQYFCTITVFLFAWRTSRVFPLAFRVVFVYLVTAGWIFGVSSCVNSINQFNQINQSNQSRTKILNEI